MLDNTKVTLQSQTKNAAVISIEPLERGYGHTLGNSLRRVMLNSLIGAAITRVRIKGVPHQFMTLEGMTEDVVDLLLNVKKIRVKSFNDEPVTLKLNAKGAGEVTAGDIEKSSQVEVANPELVLAHLAAGAQLSMELVVEKGVGYLTGEERVSSEVTDKAKLGEIVLDAHFSPITRVNYTVEATRVGRITNFDKLNMEVHTDGTLTPTDALKQSADILSQYFTFFGQCDVSESSDEKEEKVKTVAKHEDALTVDELDLSPKIANRLKENGFDTVSTIITAGRDELLKMPNFGEKSFKEVEEKLKEKGFEF